MLGALLYLRLTSLKNQIVSRAKRLRQPKYLAGALAGAAYFYFIFFRRIGSAPGGHGPRRAAAHAADTLPLSAAFAETLPLVAAVATHARELLRTARLRTRGGGGGGGGRSRKPAAEEAPLGLSWALQPYGLDWSGPL